ncbi:hypothetical protein [Conexibacter arvalis]|uniref:Uncharacterized protein n=1 Tax=Conexibacter arvalis TaxID=912552 RepID=A0A840IF73_9ACTN|nr:hypothetical protein [Conexibacter arvalis]MBB4662590.1 hypothetical protein [Conexibacter arvalis]
MSRAASSVVWATPLSLGYELTPATMAAQLVRTELELFPAVVDVLPSTTPGTVIVVHEGPARPAAWLAELREAGIV